MSPYSLPALLAFAINVSLVIIIILDDLRSRTNRLFALLIFCFVLWDAADIIVVNSTTHEAAAIGGAIMGASVLFAPAFLLLLSFVFPHSINPAFDRRGFRLSVFILPLVFTVLVGVNAFTPIVPRRFDGEALTYVVVGDTGSPLSVAMYVFIFLYLAWAMVNNIRRLGRARSGDERRRILPVMFVTVGLILLIGALGILRGRSPHPIAYRAVSFLVSLFFAYVVLGNRLVVLRRIGGQGIAYTLVTGLMFAFYVIVVTHLADVLAKQTGRTGILLEMVLVVILAVALRPIIVRMDSVVERMLSRNLFRYRQKFSQLTRETLRETSVAGLAAAVEAFLHESLSASWVDVMMRDAGAGVFRSARDASRMLTDATVVPVLSTKDHRPIEIAELAPHATGEERQMLMSAEGGYAVPLLTEKGLAGVLLVGPVTTGRAYTLDETDFLALVADGVSMVAERNSLVERIRAEELRVAKMEKLASLGRLTAGIAHEFRNPLNIISTAAQTMLRHPEDMDLHRETGKYIVEETERLSRTVDEFLQFAKPHTPVWERCSIGDVIARVLQSLQGAARIRGVEMHAEMDPSVSAIVTSPQHVERVLLNLGLNAVEAMPRGGVLTFGVLPEGSQAMLISVRDTGPGIPVEHHARLFDPFFTTKPNGTGLGLAIVYMLVQGVKGKITFTSTAVGTTFILELPIDGSQL